MKIERYIITDSEGRELDYLYEKYDEAKADAQERKGQVICYEFEFSDSYLVDDFTERSDDERE